MGLGLLAAWARGAGRLILCRWQYSLTVIPAWSSSMASAQVASLQHLGTTTWFHGIFTLETFFYNPLSLNG